MRHKGSPKTFGMACFGRLFQKKPSRSGKGKHASGSSKSKRGTSKHLSGNSKRSQSSKKAQENQNMVKQKSRGSENSVRNTELRKKIMCFRELVDLPPCIGSSSVIELVKHTVKELHKLHPDVIYYVSVSVSNSGAMDKAINELCACIKSLGKHWMHNDEWMIKSKNEANGDLEKHALALLDDIIYVAREKLYNKTDTDKDNDNEMKESVDSPSSSHRKSSPNSVLPKLTIAKMDPHVAEGDEGTNTDGNPDCNVRVQMEILVPSSSLKSIVGSESVQLIPAAGLSPSDSERQSISAMIVSSPPQLVDSEASQLPPLRPPSGEVEISPQDPLPKETESPPTAQGCLAPPPPPPPPPPQLLTRGEGDTGASVPPLPSPSMTRSSATATSVSPPTPPPPPPLPSSTVASDTSLSPPPGPPSSFTTNNVATPPPPPPPPPGHGMPVSLGAPPPPPPPPLAPAAPAAPAAPGTIPPPPSAGPVSASQSMQEVKGGAPPPPPAVGSGGRLLRKSVSKLKRSSQMGCLYRQLKAKVEGSGTKTKTHQKKDSKVGIASAGDEKKGMADALAEMTKRSSYFQQIEEDVKNYSDSIREVKAALISFKTTDMNELINFHKYVESHLEKLTDETQVLARFEDFPSKKLEGLRMAAALYNKLDAIATTLQNWNIEPPVNQLLDRVENYFNKIKGELDTLERTKDEEVKKFKSQNIHFDFAILIRIKELMVDVSSSCMELALKEKKLGSGSKKNGKKSGSGKVLWKAFQFAFRVYSFAGGHDDRAENLTRELAQQIQADTVQ